MKQEKQIIWFNQVVADYGPGLLRYLQRWVSTELSQEIIQESFLKLWQEDPQSLEHKVKEWLFCVCRNRAFDHLRKESKMSHFDSKNQNIRTDPETDPDRQLERRQEQTEITLLMEKLNFNEKEVLRLKFQEGFSYKQISEITGHTVSHVGVLIHQGIQKIKSERAG